MPFLFPCTLYTTTECLQSFEHCRLCSESLFTLCTPGFGFQLGYFNFSCTLYTTVSIAELWKQFAVFKQSVYTGFSRLWVSIMVFLFSPYHVRHYKVFAELLKLYAVFGQSVYTAYTWLLVSIWVFWIFLCSLYTTNKCLQSFQDCTLYSDSLSTLGTPSFGF